MPFYDLFGVLEFEVDEYIEEESQIRADVEMQAHGPLPPGYLSREEQEMADRAAEVAASVADFSAKLREKCARCCRMRYGEAARAPASVCGAGVSCALCPGAAWGRAPCECLPLAPGEPRTCRAPMRCTADPFPLSLRFALPAPLTS